MEFLRATIESKESIRALMHATLFMLIGLVLILKAAKIASFIFYPHFKFEKNLTVKPKIRLNNYTLSWVVSILFMPLIILYNAPEPIFSDYLNLLKKEESGPFVLALTYYMTLSLLLAALIERLLPGKMDDRKRRLWLYFITYLILLFLIFTYVLMIEY